MLADLELGTFIARLDGLTLLEPRVGPSGEEAESMGVEGAKVVDDFKRITRRICGALRDGVTGDLGASLDSKISIDQSTGFRQTAGKTNRISLPVCRALVRLRPGRDR